MEIRTYFRALKKYWWVVIAATLLGVGAAVLVSQRIAPKYESTVSFFVSTPTDAAGTPLQADQYATRRINSYLELLTSDTLARDIVAKTHVDLSAEGVKKTITGASPPNTVILKATVRDTSAPRSLQIATAIAEDFGPLVTDFENRGSAKATVALKVTSGPTVDSSPVSPNKILNYAIGLLVGLVLGAIAAFVRELTDTTIRSTELLQSLAGFPVVGVVSLEKSARKKSVIDDLPVHRSARAEEFRQLRTNLQFIDAANPVKVIVVSSATAGEGKSTTAANLAIVFAEAGQRVLLIEADLRRPRLAEYLNIEGSVGLTNVLAGQASIDEVLQPWGRGGLSVLTSGSIPPNPSELLGSPSMTELMVTLTARFDFILLDTPPLLPVTDAAVAAVHADGVVLVVRYGKTTRAEVAMAASSLVSVEARVLGTVLNMRPADARSKAYEEFDHNADAALQA